MAFSADIHRRRSLRLKDYDYAQAGTYFVTVCTQNRECLFGEVVEGEVQLNEIGRMVASVWQAIPDHYPHVVTDEFVVMPNHMHGILFFDHPAVGAGLVPALEGSIDPNRATTRVAPTMLGDVVGAFKSRATVGYIQGVKNCGWPPFAGRVWQRNYYEHVIRNEDDLARIREYIASNPLQWALDRENPANIKQREA